MKRLITAFTTLALLGAVSLAPRAEDDPYASVRDKLQLCQTCHGEKGASTLPQYPILAGQQMYYLYVQLKDFAAGRRQDSIMTPMLQKEAKMTRDEMKLVATYFSEQKWPKTNYTVTEEQKHAAELMAGSAECTACHLGGFKGNSRVPRLGGQHEDYLLKTMLDFKYRRRTNAPFMNSLMETFDEKAIEAMAAYAASMSD
ncbi:MAG: cytochrome c4 [Gammaproteobacteria bacterium]|nr:MAG: cytochrome c4 [Gammaproteobacteria bacterium]